VLVGLQGDGFDQGRPADVDKIGKLVVLTYFVRPLLVFDSCWMLVRVAFVVVSLCSYYHLITRGDDAGLGGKVGLVVQTLSIKCQG